MKFQQLRYFVAVVETGSVTDASRRLNVSQPALSAGLKALEVELGGALIDRKRGDLRPTALGAQFHQRAIGILRECDAAKIEFRRGLSRPRIRVGLLSTISMQFVLAFRRLLGEVEPALDLSLREGDVETLLSWLSRGRIDAALLTIDAAEGGGWVPLFEEPMVLMCASGHQMAKSASAWISDLDGEPFVLRNHCERSRDAHNILSARGVRPRIVLRTDQDHRAFEAVRSCLGVTIAPVSLGADVAIVPLEDLGLTRTVGVQFSGRHEIPQAGAFAEALRQAAEECRVRP